MLSLFGAKEIFKMLPYAILIAIIAYLGVTNWSQKGVIVGLKSDIKTLNQEKSNIVQQYKAEKDSCEIKIQEAVNEILFTEVSEEINSTISNTSAIKPGDYHL